MTSVNPDPAHAETPLQLLDAPTTAGVEGEPSWTQQRTMNAVRLLDFGGMFAARFLNRTYGSVRPRRLRLTDADSQTTMGGRLARRSILLVPDDGARDTVVVGWVDVANKNAELRTFESLQQYFAERFARPVDLAIDEYATLMLDVAQFLRTEGIHLSLLPATERPPATPALAAVTVRPLAAFWLVGLLTGFFLGYAWFGV